MVPKDFSKRGEEFEHDKKKKERQSAEKTKILFKLIFTQKLYNRTGIKTSQIFKDETKKEISKNCNF